ncbi:RimK family alpha-L-glutamate ligase [Halovenus rubra]|uniref:RimK family alpha-L-glutamate ligase n=2 Tax=Halovenus rubra TaxID=869890 RepID=A0ACC7E3Y3_9EURY|nr:RimK family alpha-L-glutamate ligase [Halovenus rubra]
MLRLAVATNAETYDRIQEPLAARGIEADHVDLTTQSISLSSPPVDAAAFDVGFVYPARLAEGGVTDALLDVPWVNGRDEMLRSRHKGECLARLSAAGLSVPETVIVSNPANEDDLVAAFEQISGPVVVKPNSTTRGIGVAKVTDLDSFLGVCDYLDLVHDYRATGDQSFLVQEYVPNARDFRVMLVDGDVVGAVERRLPDDALAAGQWKHNVHRGAEATGIDLTDDLQSLAKSAADVLGLSWLGVDLLVTDDRAVVNETNARPTVDSATKYDDGFWDDVADIVYEQV